MNFTLCTSGAIVIKAGVGVSSVASASGSILQQFCDEAEGYINGMTRFDWVANYSSVGANFKPILSDACSALAATYLISYDMSGYMTTAQAEDKINILYDRAMNAIKVLTDEKLKTKAGVST